MPLSGYGLLIGKIVGSRPQQGGHPHWLLMVQPALKGHPPYRVAVNLESSASGAAPEVQYQVIDVNASGTPALRALVRNLVERGPTDSFLVGPDVPRLDFVRGDLLDPGAFATVPAGANPLSDQFQQALQAAAAADESAGAAVAVFGTGYPVNKRTGGPPATGYEGVDNLHMNQGSFHRTGGEDFFLENGPQQDGGLIFLLPTGPKAFFVKFQSQTLATGPDGNPTITGIPRIDEVASTILPDILLAPNVVAAVQARAEPSAGAEVVKPTGFVFADPDPNDETGKFIPDDDGTTATSPFVVQFSQGRTRGPVPKPRHYPTMRLTDVVGETIPGHVSGAGVETIEFDMLGDSGAVDASKLKGEVSVGELIARNAKADPPAFLFHLGDVVYYYGEKQFYYGQFAEVFKQYPAPIFAIPGNHDGITYDASMVSLDSFQQAFCAEVPGRWDGFGGGKRSTMTQPGVYFTLDAPLVSIIGLYSNCGESYGWLDDQQLAFFYSELERLQALKAADGRAVLLAIHHCPRWFPDANPPDPTSAALDAACAKAQFWPDAVVVGHAHLYQRIVRQVGGRDIPYIVAGAGGHGIEPSQELAKKYVSSLPPERGCVLFEPGYVHAKVAKTAAGAVTLTLDYHSLKQTGAAPRDSCAIDLAGHKLLPVSGRA